MNLQELHDKRGRLVTEARSALDEIKANTDESRTAELEQRHDAIMADFDATERLIEREENLARIEKRQAERLEQRRPRGSDSEHRGQREGDEGKLEYRDVFSKAMRLGADQLNAEERALLIEHRAQSAGTGTEGGYTVPEGFSGEIDKQLAAWGPMLDAAFVRQYPTATGNPIPWPTVNYTAIEGELKAENASVTDDNGNDVVFGQKTLEAYLYDSEVVRVSIELLQDSAFNMQGLLNELFGESLGRKVNKDLTTANGSSKPNGIVNASSLGTTAAATAAVTSDELITFQHTVDPAYRMSPSCLWQFNDSTLAAIRKLKDGQNNYLWQMGDVRAGEPSTLLGKPYAVNQAMASLGAAAKAIIFGDHSRYVVRRAGGMIMLALRERYMDKLQVGFIAYMRVDGELLNTAAVKHLITAAS